MAYGLTKSMTVKNVFQQRSKSVLGSLCRWSVVSLNDLWLRIAWVPSGSSLKDARCGVFWSVPDLEKKTEDFLIEFEKNISEVCTILKQGKVSASVSSYEVKILTYMKTVSTRDDFVCQTPSLNRSINATPCTMSQAVFLPAGPDVLRTDTEKLIRERYESEAYWLFLGTFQSFAFPEHPASSPPSSSDVQASPFLAKHGDNTGCCFQPATLPTCLSIPWYSRRILCKCKSQRKEVSEPSACGGFIVAETAHWQQIPRMW